MGGCILAVRGTFHLRTPGWLCDAQRQQRHIEFGHCRRDLEDTVFCENSRRLLLKFKEADQVDAPSASILQVSRQSHGTLRNAAALRAQREQRVPVGCQWLALAAAAPSQC